MFSLASIVTLIFIAILILTVLKLVITAKKDNLNSKSFKNSYEVTDMQFMENFYSDILTKIEATGFHYDSSQDIFYSAMDSWQRNAGYSVIYDEAMAAVGMVVQCEPIRFIYKSENWMIEFWKGQYGMATGAEIGVYVDKNSNPFMEELINEKFYNCADNTELLEMEFRLKKDGEILFVRKESHWWLTGFRMGEYSRPEDLIMYISITFKDEEMRMGFVNALLKEGYNAEEIAIKDCKVEFKFDTPYTAQPKSQKSFATNINQSRNRKLCLAYQEAMEKIRNSDEIIKCQDMPEIYNHLLSIGKTELLSKEKKDLKE